MFERFPSSPFPLIMVTLESHFLMSSISNLHIHFFLMLKDPAEEITSTTYDAWRCIGNSLLPQGKELAEMVILFLLDSSILSHVYVHRYISTYSFASFHLFPLYPFLKTKDKCICVYHHVFNIRKPFSESWLFL